MSRRKAFSLIELLIVTAIIAVLVAVLFPAYRGLSDHFKLILCQSNLKAVHRVLMAYAELSNGYFPQFHDYFGGSIFHPAQLNEPQPVTMSDAILLKELGANAEMWFCPLDVFYGRETWVWRTWTSQQYTLSLGYTVFINRRVNGPGGASVPATFADGRLSPVTDDCDHNVPLVADLLRYRNDGRLYGWHHGGGVLDDDAEGLFNSSCNTLFRGGHVVYKDWRDLENQGPGLVMGTARDDFWFFWLGSDSEAR